MSDVPHQERQAALRILDANFDRASEGLRVIEEYARFYLDDTTLTGQLKSLRHRLINAIRSIPADDLLAARNTPDDVGREITTASEYERTSLSDVVCANCRRVQQALRSIEEYGKLLDAGLAREVEAIRYDTYTLEKALLRPPPTRDRLVKARLYVLIDGSDSEQAFADKVQALISAEVDILQLRDKQLDDRALLARARRLRQLTSGSETLFIMNDRPDLAAVAHADGVHVGQEELPVAEARKIVGADLLIGVSTHNLEQVRQAVRDGADYIGCGPTFASSTKSFEHFPGLDYLREVAAEIVLPAFAIGGITLANVEQVLATGIQRVAVSSAIAQASDPGLAAKALLQRLA
jgi:thiamine-phosphate pyrophosphorylase